VVASLTDLHVFNTPVVFLWYVFVLVYAHMDRWTDGKALPAPTRLDEFYSDSELCLLTTDYYPVRINNLAPKIKALHQGTKTKIVIF
jgi:hypothetical protein